MPLVHTDWAVTCLSTRLEDWVTLGTWLLAAGNFCAPRCPATPTSNSLALLASSKLSSRGEPFLSVLEYCVNTRVYNQARCCAFSLRCQGKEMYPGHLDLTVPCHL